MSKYVRQTAQTSATICCKIQCVNKILGYVQVCIVIVYTIANIVVHIRTVLIVIKNAVIRAGDGTDETDPFPYPPIKG